MRRDMSLLANPSTIKKIPYSRDGYLRMKPVTRKGVMIILEWVSLSREVESAQMSLELASDTQHYDSEESGLVWLESAHRMGEEIEDRGLIASIIFLTMRTCWKAWIICLELGVHRGQGCHACVTCRVDRLLKSDHVKKADGEVWPHKPWKSRVIW